MNKKVIWIIFAAVFVLFIGAASVMYQKYSKEIEKESLVTESEQQAEVKEDTEAEEETAEEEADSGDVQEDSKEVYMAPDFGVYDESGAKVNLSDFLGKPVVLNFWASWCGPCQMEMPVFQKKYEELGEEVHFMMVNMTEGSRETLDSAKKFIESADYDFPVYYDTDTEAAIAYGVYSLPITYFINAEGHAIGVASGTIDEETLQYGIDMIKGE